MQLRGRGDSSCSSKIAFGRPFGYETDLIPPRAAIGDRGSQAIIRANVEKAHLFSEGGNSFSTHRNPRAEPDVLALPGHSQFLYTSLLTSRADFVHSGVD